MKRISFYLIWKVHISYSFTSLTITVRSMQTHRLCPKMHDLHIQMHNHICYITYKQFCLN